MNRGIPSNFFIAILLATPPAFAQTWIELGGSASGNGLSDSATIANSSVSLALDSQGLPVVAYHQGLDILVRRWNGLDWVEPGAAGSGLLTGGSALTVRCTSPAIAVEPGGAIVVAWLTEAAGNNDEISAARWNGSAWEGLDKSYTKNGISNTPVDSRKPVLAVTSDGRPVVAWEEQVSSTNTEIYVSLWDPGLSKWTPLHGSGGISTSTFTSEDPSIATGPDGRIVVAWSEGNSGGTEPFANDIYLLSWNNTESDWESLAGSGDLGGINRSVVGSKTPSVALTASGAPIVAWSEGSMINPNESYIYVRGLVGNSWIEAAGSGSGTGIHAPPAMMQCRAPSIRIDSTGSAVVAYTILQNTAAAEGDVFVRRYRDGAWSGIGSSGSGTGISQSPATSSMGPKLVLAAADQPTLAWIENVAGKGQVYLKQTNRPPVMTGTEQATPDGVVIGPGGTILTLSAVLAGQVLDPEGQETLLEVEVQEVGSPYPGLWTRTTPLLPAGTTPSVTIQGLLRGKSYHWRARAQDLHGEYSAWAHFGAASEDETDFAVRSNSTSVPTTMEQRYPVGGGLLPVGQTFFSETGVVILAAAGDSENDPVAFEVEVQPVGTDFDGTLTHGTVMIPPGDPIAMTIALPDGPKHWRIRTVDALGEGSAWVSYGGNDESEADFVLTHPGGSLGRSMDAPRCGESAGVAGASLPLLLALLLLRNRQS